MKASQSSWGVAPSQHVISPAIEQEESVLNSEGVRGNLPPTRGHGGVASNPAWASERTSDKLQTKIVHRKMSLDKGKRTEKYLLRGYTDKN